MGGVTTTAQPAQALGGGEVQNVSYDTGYYVKIRASNGKDYSIGPGSYSEKYTWDADGWWLPAHRKAGVRINNGSIFYVVNTSNYAQKIAVSNTQSHKVNIWAAVV